MPRALLLILICLIIGAGVKASPRFRHYTTENGLPANCIRQIIQDRNGFVWCATDGGVIRFDGATPRLIPILRNTSTLENDYISAIHESNDGQLWIATDLRLLRLNPLTQRFEPLDITFTPTSRHKSQALIKTITSDPDGQLWIATVNNGLFRLDPKTLTAKNFDIPELSNLIDALFVDSQGTVWIANNRGQGVLMRLDKAADTFRPLPVTWQGKPMPIVATTIAQDPTSHLLWLGLWDDGLACLNPYTAQITKLLTPSALNGLTHIHTITPAPGHMLYVGSDGGLTAYNTLTDRAENIRPQQANPASLSDRFVYPILLDNEQGLWIGTFYGGINYLAPDLKHFDTSCQPDATYHIEANIIAGLCEDYRGDVWISSDDGGVWQLDAASGTCSKVHLHSPEAVEISSNTHGLCADGQYIWIGTYTTGLARYHIPTKVLSHYYPRVGKGRKHLPGWSCYAVHKDDQGRIWAGTLDGLTLYDPASDSFTLVKETGYLVIDIDHDAAGCLWLSTHGGGLMRYNPATDVWRTFRHSAQANSIPSDHVNATLIHPDGTVWCATPEGLCSFNPTDETFTVADLGTVPSRSICAIVPDRDKLWLTTTNGLLCYSPSGKSVEIFTSADGLSSNQFNANVAIMTSQGKIYAGTVKGINAFFPHQLSLNTVLPPVVFTGLDIHNTPVEMVDARIDLSSQRPRITLSAASDKAFTIHFAALSYVNPQSNTYRYRLDGFDKKWIETNDPRAAYTNIPPGTYTLRIQGSNSDRIWSPDTLTLDIVISPPWYASLPMKIAYTVVFALVILGIVWMLLKRQEARHRRIIASHDALREKEAYQAKMDFFTMIAHEIRTPVSLIIGPLDKITAQSQSLPSPVVANLKIIDRNARRLLSLVNQLLDFKKIEQNPIRVSFASENLNALIVSVVERFTPSVEQKGGTIVLSLPSEPVFADIDAESITKLVSNLLNNARKFMVSTIQITLTSTSDQFQITVADDGCGISSDDARRIFLPFVQASQPTGENGLAGTGLGLSIVKAVVNAHNGQIALNSSPGTGAEFVVTIPLRQNIQPLPATDTNTSATATADPDPDDLNRPVMLVVDDNAEMCRFIADHFATSYCVVTAADGLQALDTIRSRHIDLIVSDWMMPRLDGEQLCHALRSDPNFSHIPFVMLTAKTDDVSKIQSMRIGADAYVEKPFSIAYLEARIKNLIDMRALLCKRFSQSPLEPISTLAPSTADSEFLTRITTLIEDNFSNPDLNVDFIASQMAISRSSLYAKIKTIADITPNELIQITRLKRAAQLLAERRYRINEIAYMVGFNSPSYFTKCFQRQFGLKPAEFHNRPNTQTK